MLRAVVALALKDFVGEKMGEPASCERYGIEGDALQQTTTGLARYRKASNTPTFTPVTEQRYADQCS